MSSDDQRPADTPTEATGLEGLVARNRERFASGQARVNELLDSNRDRPMVQIALLIYQRDQQTAGSVLSSALAFRLFLFMVPFLVFLIGLLGFLGDVIDQRGVEQAGIGGAIAAQIEDAFSQPGATRWLAVIGGLFGAVLAGRTLSRVLVAASCLSWQLPVRLRASLRALGLIVGLVSALLLAIVVVNWLRRDHGLAVAGVSLAAAFALYAVAWLAISLALPRATKDPGAVLPGTLLVAATLVGLQVISTLILPDRFARASRVYGAVGATIVALGWLFIASRVMVLSMTVNAAIFERFGSTTRFVFSLPGLRALARRSAWLRRFFDLEDEAQPSGLTEPGGERGELGGH